MPITVSTRSLDLFTRRGNTRVLWRSTVHTTLDVADVSWGSVGVIDLTPRLVAVDTFRQGESSLVIPNTGAEYQHQVLESRTSGPMDLRLYASKDLTDEVQLLFTETGSTISGWVYFLQDVPYATATDSEGARCDWAPVFTRGAIKDWSPSNAAATYTVRLSPSAAFVRDAIVAP